LQRFEQQTSTATQVRYNLLDNGHAPHRKFLNEMMFTSELVFRVVVDRIQVKRMVRAAGDETKLNPEQVNKTLLYVPSRRSISRC